MRALLDLREFHRPRLKLTLYERRLHPRDSDRDGTAATMLGKPHESPRVERFARPGGFRSDCGWRAFPVRPTEERLSGAARYSSERFDISGAG